jgi:hypothetical protein
MDYKSLSRPLDISDVDFRVQSINKGGYATILAYKDARVDMNRLDEVLTPYGWQRDYKVIDGNLYCGVGIWNEKTDQWIWKWDVGTESMADKEKGKASDSFKRACFNVGIGRELYDYPLISVKLNANEFVSDGGRVKQTYELKLKDWTWYTEFTDNKISFIAAKDEKGIVRFKWGTLAPKKVEPVYTAASNTVDDTAEAPIEVASPVNPIVEEETDTERQAMQDEYKALFGKAPNKKVSTETLKKTIEAKIKEVLSEEIKEEEEANVPDTHIEVEVEEIEGVKEDLEKFLKEEEEDEVEEEDDFDSILNHMDKIDKFSDKDEFIQWAKGLVAEYKDIDSADVLEAFRQACNVHYSKII